MDDLIKQLQDKTGLDVGQIKSVVAGVADFLGDKLPEPIAGQITKLLGSEGGTAQTGSAGDGEGLVEKAKDLLGGGEDGGGGLLDQAKDTLGGLLGGKS